ncbi:hypothetical protein R5R35_008617 [Gryllus longicercus]|uniref:Uncharacterized protein n=1 Tax=Gryllus longicercus TaxID=2509291 RepID=A0AAN9Z4K4_9ORTH
MENIIQWNINGCISHYCELKLLLANHTPMCVCLQETHFKPEDRFNFRGYKTFRSDVEPDRRARGGVAILISNTHPASRLDLNTPLQAVAVTLYKPLKMTVCCIYLPDASWRNEDLQDLIDQLQTPFLILGDFNAHSTTWGCSRTNDSGRRIDDLLLNNEYVLLNTGASTHFNARNGSFSAIDLSICSPNLATRLTWKPLPDLHQSDHFPLLISSNMPKNTVHIPKRWCTNRADWSSFTRHIPPISVSGNSEEDVTDFTNTVISSAVQYIPQTSGRSSRIPVPWWNTETKEAIREKRKALNRYRRAPTQDNLIAFKRLRALARRKILTAKRSSWEKYVTTITRTTKVTEIWQKIRSIAGKNVFSPITCIEHEGQLICNPDEIANALATQYSKASGTNSYPKDFLDKKKEEEEQVLDFTTNIDKPYNALFTWRELQDAINAAGDTAAGSDNIPYSILRRLPKKILSTLLNIYNNIWTQSNYPKVWKEAIVIPILKAGKDPLNPENYRPVSLTCCLGKILEKMVNTRLTWCLERNNLLNIHQCGYRQHHSTIDQLIHLENAIQNTFIKRKHMVTVFFDLEKAFDKTWRHNILRQLYNWQIRGYLPKFISSFLSTRSFRVRVGQSISESCVLENGVPQGSPLSGTLFIIAINRMFDGIEASIGKCMYVDDIAIFYSAKSLGMVKFKMQNAINKLVQNAKNIGFSFTAAKTKCVHFSRKRKSYRDPELTLNGVQLTYNETAKFLGLIFDRHLTWKQHIEYTLRRCKTALNVIRCISHINWGADRDILLRLYKSMVMSKIDYGCAVYSSARKSSLRKLDPVHNAGLRYASGAFRTSPSSSLYCETSTMSLHHRRQTMLLNYRSKLLSLPKHLNHSLMTRPKLVNIYDRRPSATRPANIRAIEIEKSYNIVLPPVLKYEPYEIPVWMLKMPEVRLDTTSVKKTECLPIDLKVRFQSVLEEYMANHIIIYTDGSKTRHQVGSAFVTENLSRAWALPPEASVYTAELYAVLQSLRHCETLDSGRFVICTDSLSLLTAIDRRQTVDPLLQMILIACHKLEQRGASVTFIWCPGHVGILGNEEADSAARNAGNIQSEMDIEIRPQDARNAVSKYILTEWQTTWNSLHTKLHPIKQNISKWSPNVSYPRREQVCITRLRIGHARMTSSYMLRNEEQPICSCGRLLTVKHILTDCVDLSRLRHRCGMRGNMKIDLGTDKTATDKTIQFLKEANLFFKI